MADGAEASIGIQDEELRTLQVEQMTLAAEVLKLQKAGMAAELKEAERRAAAKDDAAEVEAQAKENAFRRRYFERQDSLLSPEERRSNHRDMFASSAMNGLLATMPSMAQMDVPPEALAQRAYVIADAMLKARET